MHNYRSSTIKFTPSRFKLRLSRRQRILSTGCCLLIALLMSSGFLYVWLHSQNTMPVHHQTTVSQSTFRPVVGDVHDPEQNDPDISVEQTLIPTFQFKLGGNILAGTVVDEKTGHPVMSAIVWINLSVQKGQPTSIALHTVTDASGHYAFQHIASGTYTLAASRYYNLNDGRYYAERIFPSVTLNNNRSKLLLPLMPVSIPDHRTIAGGQAKNSILIDLRGFYANSLLDDPLLLNQTQNFRAFLHTSRLYSSVWLPYGWRPPDQYALLTGTYPAWATYEPPHPVPWGLPDGIDTSFWFTGGRNTHLFGQESIFDVAKAYGMQTGVVAGSDYMLSDATTRNLDVLQRSSNFDANRWLTQMKDTILSGNGQANGFLLYGELAPLQSSDGTLSPDAAGDDNQQALLRADQTFGELLNWLRGQGLLQNTLIALTTSQAQANHTDADNFYGMGSTGQGTSKQTLLALTGPGQCPVTDNTSYSDFAIAPTLMHAAGLSAPAEARSSFLPSFQQGTCS